MKPIPTTGLHAAGKRVLALFAGDDQQTTEQVAAKLGVSSRTVWSRLILLTDRGHLRLVRKGRRGPKPVPAVWASAERERTEHAA